MPNQQNILLWHVNYVRCALPPSDPVCTCDLSIRQCLESPILTPPSRLIDATGPLQASAPKRVSFERMHKLQGYLAHKKVPKLVHPKPNSRVRGPKIRLFVYSKGAAVERTWYLSDNQGQIMALAYNIRRCSLLARQKTCWRRGWRCWAISGRNR